MIQKESRLRVADNTGAKEFVRIMSKILRDLGENLPEKKHIEVAEEGFKRFDFNKNKIMEFNEFFEFMRFIISEKGYDLK